MAIVKRQVPGPQARAVLVLYVSGYRRYRIAHALGIGQGTVKTHLDRLHRVGLLPVRKGVVG